MLRILFFLMIGSFCSVEPASAQNCHIKLEGFLLDKSTNDPLPFATIYITETQSGAVADENGYFILPELCAQGYHLKFSHIGCDSETNFIQIKKDTSITILLAHHVELLNETVVHGKIEDNSAQVSNTVSRKDISSQGNKNLADVLENIAGVSVIKNGAGISKPVVHGLYGNRIAILNNGIAQAGQQWGNDHAPEIDPFVADHLSVIKGASALAYGGNSLGSVVMIDVDKIKADPHLHGETNYLFQTNGLGHTLNTKLEKSANWAAWRLTATLKTAGDMQTPNYYLTNTGRKEADIALQAEKSINNKLSTSLYYSLFNTEIGLLRGAHIGNLTDLEEAITRPVPFFTRDTFSYSITAPRQTVMHHLLKLSSTYFLAPAQVLSFTYGGQLNNRKEYDVRRGDREKLPALSLLQQSHFAEALYKATLKNKMLLKTGLQLTFIDNTNNPETGILPLIPDYRQYNTATFAILQKEKNKLFYEFGARYTFEQLNVVAISTTLPRVIERNNYSFNNYTLSAAAKYEITPNQKAGLDIGYMLRSPQVNELYSSGLHQGVSGIEEGQRNLTQEKSVKLVLSDDFSINQKLYVQALAYYQYIQDYIYLQPQNEFRLTIRGAFPWFIYEQTDATLYGADLLVTYEPINNMKILAKYSLVRGTDVLQNIPLINMPADNLYANTSFTLPNLKPFKSNTIGVNGKYVWRQTRLLTEQDFLPPPDAYFLLGFSIDTHLSVKKSELKLSLTCENMLNSRYRDYLNRQRYFADESGINMGFRVNYAF